MEVEDVTIDKVYSLGEKMSKAGMNTLMGMGTVFAVLILISLVISCFKIFPYLGKQEKSRTDRDCCKRDSTGYSGRTAG